MQQSPSSRVHRPSLVAHSNSNHVSIGHTSCSSLSNSLTLLVLLCLLCILLPSTVFSQSPSPSSNRPTPSSSTDASLLHDDYNTNKDHNQQPLQPHNSNHNTPQPTQPHPSSSNTTAATHHSQQQQQQPAGSDSLLSERGLDDAVGGGGGEDDVISGSGSGVSDESGFWLFEFVVLCVLVPAVWYWRKRKQYITAMHHRRLDRMVNS